MATPTARAPVASAAATSSGVSPISRVDAVASPPKPVPVTARARSRATWTSSERASWLSPYAPISSSSNPVRPSARQLHLGQRPDVARQHGLVHRAGPVRPARRGERGQGRHRARQHVAAAADMLSVRRGLPGQPGDERGHVLARAGNPGHRERLDDDGRVRAARHRGHLGQFPPEQLGEHDSVQLRAQAARIQQRVVNVPQNQQSGCGHGTQGYGPRRAGVNGPSRASRERYFSQRYPGAAAPGGQQSGGGEWQAGSATRTSQRSAIARRSMR